MRSGDISNIKKGVDWVIDHWKVLLISGILIFGFIQMYEFRQAGEKLKSEARNLDAQVSSLKKDNDTLRKNIDYLRNPHNALKEVRSQFNYKRLSENLIVVISKESSSTPSSTEH